MQEQKNIIDCYNKTAKAYAAKYSGELSQKHLDRILLNAFAAENLGIGRAVDLGCGPGQTTKYLSACGLADIIGIDLSPQMVEIARENNPHLQFGYGDMLKLNYPDSFFASALAFYAIVHFDYGQLKTAFSEVKRVLKDKGAFLFSFHVGCETVHLDNFLDQEVNIDFYFFEPPKVIHLLTEMGFEVIDSIVRQAYTAVEYPSRRAYIWTKNNKG